MFDIRCLVVVLKLLHLAFLAEKPFITHQTNWTIGSVEIASRSALGLILKAFSQVECGVHCQTSHCAGWLYDPEQRICELFVQRGNVPIYDIVNVSYKIGTLHNTGLLFSCVTYSEINMSSLGIH